MMRVLIIGGSGFIGTNLCENFYAKNINYRNIDIAKPKLDRQDEMWEFVDVLNYEDLQRVILCFQPTIIINLAAQTDTTLTDQKSHEVNLLSITNLTKVLNKNSLSCKIIHFSSMLINDLGTPVAKLDQFNSTNWYGKMKGRAEQYLNAYRGIDYCILRPTSIYGPYMGAPYEELFKMSTRRFMPPYPRKMGMRPFGFVGNVVKQVEYVIRNFAEYNGKTFYLMDCTDLNVKIISTKIRLFLGLNSPITLNNFVFKYIAFLGDLLKRLNLRFPLTSVRYKNLITSQTIPDHLNVKLDQEENTSTDDGIIKTVNWMKAFGKGFNAEKD